MSVLSAVGKGVKLVGKGVGGFLNECVLQATGTNLKETCSEMKSDLEDGYGKDAIGNAVGKTYNDIIKKCSDDQLKQMQKSNNIPDIMLELVEEEMDRRHIPYSE